MGLLQLNLVGSGWAECVISDGAVSVVATMSYLSDGIGEFVAAVQSLFQGANIATCYFAEEPGCFRWTLAKAGSDVLVALCWNPEDSETSEGWEPRFRNLYSIILFAESLDKELDRNLMKWGLDGYEREWGFRFPVEAHGRLKDGIRRCKGQLPE